MKKIVSIVLALVLVLAIAAPAMAITGYEQSPALTPAAVAPYAIDVSLVAAPQGNTLGILTLSSPATNKAYVANEVAFFRVDLAVNHTDVTKGGTTMNPDDYYGSDLTVSSDAVTLLDMACYQIDTGAVQNSIAGIVGITGATGTVAYTGNAALNTTYNTLTFENIVAPGAAVAKYVMVGTGIVKAQGTINVTIKGGNMEKFKALEKAALADTYYKFYNNNGKLLYLVKETAGNDVVVINYDKLGNSYYFLFERSEKNEVEGIKYLGNDGNSARQIYYKSLAQGGVDTFTVEGLNPAVDAEAKTIAAVKAQLDDIFTYFNFVWEAKGLLLDGHFTQKLNSLYLTDSAIVNLYTGAAITVPDPEVEIPQTGDAATTIGFVMVAMAIVAAAAVAYKKVRA